MKSASFAMWRHMHRIFSGLIAIFALVHLVIGVGHASGWGPDTIWFVATGLGLLFLAASNWAHVGLEPCPLPTAPVVRWGNWAWAALGVVAVSAIPEMHAYLLAAGLVGQALTSQVTLRGPI